MAVGRVRFVMERDYASKALRDGSMRSMINKKAQLARALYFGRSKKVTGENARSGKISVFVGGEKHQGDRWEAELAGTSDHAVVEEFGRVERRGGRYSQAVAKRYGRTKTGRATKRRGGKHVMGGNNRRINSIVKTLEEQ